MSIKDAIESAGPGARTGKLEEIGDILRGTVLSAELRQARDDDGKPDVWDDGNPKQQVVVLLQTDLDEGPDDDDKEDDGKRTYFIKWWGEQRKAFVAAVRLAEVDDLYPGDLFAVKYIGDGERAKKTWSPPKLLKFKITPKPKGSGVADEFDGDEKNEETVTEQPARKPVPRLAARKAAAATSNAKKLAAAGLDADDL